MFQYILFLTSNSRSFKGLLKYKGYKIESSKFTVGNSEKVFSKARKIKTMFSNLIFNFISSRQTSLLFAFHVDCLGKRNYNKAPEIDWESLRKNYLTITANFRFDLQIEGIPSVELCSIFRKHFTQFHFVQEMYKKILSG